MPSIYWPLHHTIVTFIISCKGVWVGCKGFDKKSMFTTYCMGGCDSPRVPWHMVLVCSPNQMVTVTRFSEVQSYLPFCHLDHGWWVSHLVESMFSQNDSFWFCPTLRFYNLWPGSQSSHEGILSMDGCNSYCWGRDTCEGFLIWPFFWHHSEYFLFKFSVKYALQISSPSW